MEFMFLIFSLISTQLRCIYLDGLYTFFAVFLLFFRFTFYKNRIDKVFSFRMILFVLCIIRCISSANFFQLSFFQLSFFLFICVFSSHSFFFHFTFVDFGVMFLFDLILFWSFLLLHNEKRLLIEYQVYKAVFLLPCRCLYSTA